MEFYKYLPLSIKNYESIILKVLFYSLEPENSLKYQSNKKNAYYGNN